MKRSFLWHRVVRISLGTSFRFILLFFKIAKKRSNTSMTTKQGWKKEEETALVESIQVVKRDWVKVSARMSLVHKVTKTPTQCSDHFQAMEKKHHAVKQQNEAQSEIAKATAPTPIGTTPHLHHPRRFIHQCQQVQVHG